MNTSIQELSRGERAPDFIMPVLDDTPTRFYAKAGGEPTILVFCEADEAGLLTEFSQALTEAAADTFALFAIKQANPAAESPEGWATVPFPVFTDVQGKGRQGYRLDPGSKPTFFVLDPNLRVLGSLPLAEPAESARKALALLNDTQREVEPLTIAMQAPVLFISNILEPSIATELIQIWENQGNEETGVEQSHAGRRVDQIQPDQKRRRDHTVKVSELLKRLTMTIGRRVMPEIGKAFAFKATRFEGFKIVCYDSETGGFFHPHRDNLSPATAHRRFALTLNLNDDYEGGHLKFPEYGPNLYRPEAGSGLIFSCSHLHEVTPVTKGRRFALLSFLFREADMRARESPGKS